MRKAKWPGNWKFDCKRCGWTFPSEDIKLEWTGLHVCGKCWEPKHPQLLIKIREETAVPSFINEDSSDLVVTYCDITTSSPYAGMGVAGCMQVGPYIVTYQALLDLETNGH